MAVSLTTYGGLVNALADWLARSGDTDITSRADDFIALCEQRLYFGSDEVPGVIPAMEAVRIPEMYTVNASFTLSQNVAQPTGLLELKEAMVNDATSAVPLRIVDESILDEQYPDSGEPRWIALSGNNFRLWPDPGTAAYTATLRYYAQLPTPSSANPTNYILSTTPGVYLNGCLLAASLFSGDFEGAAKYGGLYTADVGALNTRAQRRLASAHPPKIIIRGWNP